MKDKVFFDRHTAQFNYDKRNDDDICYIRKDALLEWAKNNRDSAGKLSFTEFIDKIESL